MHHSFSPTPFPSAACALFAQNTGGTPWPELRRPLPAIPISERCTDSQFTDGLRRPSAGLAVEGGGGFEGVDVAGDFGRELVFGDLEVVAGLEVHPEGGGVLEIASEAQSGVGGDAAALVDDVGDAGNGDAKVESEFVHAQAQGLEEFFAKNLAGVDGFEFLGHLFPLVVIHNLDVIGVGVAPAEANPPLVVDADAVLALAIPFKLLQPVTRQGGQRAEIGRGIEHSELALGGALDGFETPDGLAVKKPLGFGAAERPDHRGRVYRYPLNVNRYGAGPQGLKPAPGRRAALRVLKNSLPRLKSGASTP